jgi:hypothetical protein
LALGVRVGGDQRGVVQLEAEMGAGDRFTLGVEDAAGENGVGGQGGDGKGQSEGETCVRKRYLHKRSSSTIAKIVTRYSYQYLK